ncbi:MAG: hypothetical protein JJT96_11415 [Opitutales bacterium]|nr:hypothetical protein [Opitutales bacterium]
MTSNKSADSAWEATTWKGHRLAQHRAFLRLSFADKLKSIEELGEFAADVLRRKRARGEPYIDPETGELVRGRRAQAVGEDPPPFPASGKDEPPARP